MGTDTSPSSHHVDDADGRRRCRHSRATPRVESIGIYTLDFPGSGVHSVRARLYPRPRAGGRDRGGGGDIRKREHRSSVYDRLFLSLPCRRLVLCILWRVSGPFFKRHGAAIVKKWVCQQFGEEWKLQKKNTPMRGRGMDHIAIALSHDLRLCICTGHAAAGCCSMMLMWGGNAASSVSTLSYIYPPCFVALILLMMIRYIEVRVQAAQADI